MMRRLLTKLHKPCCVFRGSAGSPETRILNFQIDLFVHGKSSRREEVREKCLVMKKEAGLKNLMSRAGFPAGSPIMYQSATLLVLGVTPHLAERVTLHKPLNLSDPFSLLQKVMTLNLYCPYFRGGNGSSE